MPSNDSAARPNNDDVRSERSAFLPWHQVSRHPRAFRILLSVPWGPAKKQILRSVIPLHVRHETKYTDDENFKKYVNMPHFFSLISFFFFLFLFMASMYYVSCSYLARILYHLRTSFSFSRIGTFYSSNKVEFIIIVLLS